MSADPSPEQAALLKSLKLGRGAEVEARDQAGRPIGRLTMITEAAARDDTLVADLCRWRAANMSGFLTVFQPTMEKTRDYLDRLAVPDPRRVLFLIQDAEGRRVGNIGLCNIAPGKAEIDNVVRGETVETPAFMSHVQEALIGWAAATLGVARVYLNVLSDNPRAVASYERAGYVETDRVPLMRVDTTDGYRLVPDPAAPDGAVSLIRMERMAAL